MYMEMAQDLASGSFGPIKWREYQFSSSRHKRWSVGSVEVERIEERRLPPEWNPFPFKPYTNWKFRARIGRLNLEGTWHGQTD